MKLTDAQKTALMLDALSGFHASLDVNRAAEPVRFALRARRM